MQFLRRLISRPPAPRSHNKPCAPSAQGFVSAGLLCLLVVAAAGAIPQLDQLQSLAVQRYGIRIGQVIAEWRASIPNPAHESDRTKLEDVNSYINARLRYVEDIHLWGQEDYWATLLESSSKGAGDCEDCAIAKYVTLLSAGVPESRLRMTYVRALMQINGVEQGIGHMVLAYYAEPSSEPLVLDNLVRDIRPASRRPDLIPVYSFNQTGMWTKGATASFGDPTARISKWRDVLTRLQNEFTI